ncbi:MAG: hypothetical protein FJZ01_02485 [Candidatus Sericytochromatia bacterium]|nr:hypothetical protein [Candidatus Tanganyikabacteria bacterium]
MTYEAVFACAACDREIPFPLTACRRCEAAPFPAAGSSGEELLASAEESSAAAWHGVALACGALASGWVVVAIATLN